MEIRGVYDGNGAALDYDYGRSQAHGPAQAGAPSERQSVGARRLFHPDTQGAATLSSLTGLPRQTAGHLEPGSRTTTTGFPTDHPTNKLTSEVVLTVREHLMGLANGAQLSETRADGWVTTHWLHDIPHSNYLVTIVVGAFDVVVKDGTDVPLRYRPGQGERLERTSARTSRC